MLELRSNSTYEPLNSSGFRNMIYAGIGRGPTSTAIIPERSMVWLTLLIGVIVGVFSGIVGIGGGILFVPALVWIYGMNQHKAQGTSIGALLAPVGLLAFLEYYRKGNADVRIAALLAAGFLVGGFLAADKRRR